MKWWPWSADTHLYDNLHQIFLRDDVLAIDDLLQDGGENELLIHIQIHAIELGKTDEVRANEYSQIAPLHFALLTIPRVTLVLKTDPELIHLDEIGEDERNGILEVPCGSVATRTVSGLLQYAVCETTDAPGIFTDWQVTPCLPTKIVPEKEPSDGVQHASAHL